MPARTPSPILKPIGSTPGCLASATLEYRAAKCPRTSQSGLPPGGLSIQLLVNGFAPMGFTFFLGQRRSEGCEFEPGQVILFWKDHGSYKGLFKIVNRSFHVVASLSLPTVAMHRACHASPNIPSSVQWSSIMHWVVATSTSRASHSNLLHSSETASKSF